MTTSVQCVHLDIRKKIKKDFWQKPNKVEAHFNVLIE